MECNAFDAEREGAGIGCDGFDVDKLLDFAHGYSGHTVMANTQRGQDKVSCPLGVSSKNFYSSSGMMSL